MFTTGPDASYVALLQGFGMTKMREATWRIPRHRLPSANPWRPRSAEQPCYGYKMRIVGPKGSVLGPDEIGEIVGRGDNVMMGYWNTLEESAAVLRDGKKHSVDLGYMDKEGFVCITDAAKRYGRQQRRKYLFYRS